MDAKVVLDIQLVAMYMCIHSIPKVALLCRDLLESESDLWENRLTHRMRATLQSMLPGIHTLAVEPTCSHDAAAWRLLHPRHEPNVGLGTGTASRCT